MTGERQLRTTRDTHSRLPLSELNHKPARSHLFERLKCSWVVYSNLLIWGAVRWHTGRLPTKTSCHWCSCPENIQTMSYHQLSEPLWVCRGGHQRPRPSDALGLHYPPGLKKRKKKDIDTCVTFLQLRIRILIIHINSNSSWHSQNLNNLRGLQFLLFLYYFTITNM